jgi:nicotinamidase-related amidase
MEQQKNEALLILDMQLPFLASLPKSEKVIGNVAQSIKAARQKGIHVIYVVLGFRPEAPEIGETGLFAKNKAWLGSADMSDFTAIHPDLAPAENEITIVKRRVGSFNGSDLEIVLRALNIRQFTLTGINTSGVVLSTVVEASDKDYQITVISDCCADKDDKLHEVLVEKVFPIHARVVLLKNWTA